MGKPKVFISYVAKAFKGGNRQSTPKSNYKAFCAEVEAKGYIVLNTVFEAKRYPFSNSGNIKEKIREAIKNADLIYVHPDCAKETICRKEVFVARSMNIPDYGMPPTKREQALADWIENKTLSIPHLAAKYKLDEDQLRLNIRRYLRQQETPP